MVASGEVAGSLPRMGTNYMDDAGSAIAAGLKAQNAQAMAAGIDSIERVAGLVRLALDGVDFQGDPAMDRVAKLLQEVVEHAKNARWALAYMTAALLQRTIAMARPGTSQDAGRENWSYLEMQVAALEDVVDNVGRSADQRAAEAMRLAEVAKHPVVVVTRHPALVDWLRLEEHVPMDVPVIQHATADDVKGRHVYGVLPLHLAAEAEKVTEVTLDIPADRRGQELSLKDMDAMVRGVRSYVVRAL